MSAKRMEFVIFRATKILDAKNGVLEMHLVGKVMNADGTGYDTDALEFPEQTKDFKYRLYFEEKDDAGNSD